MRLTRINNVMCSMPSFRTCKYANIILDPKYNPVNIIIDKDFIRIELSSLEKIISFHGSFKIPISQIREISTDLLPPTWKEIRAPGTAIPGLTKAGTYYTYRGREFWMLKKNDNPIRIELNNNKLKRLILGVSEYEKRATIIKNLREASSK